MQRRMHRDRGSLMEVDICDLGLIKLIWEKVRYRVQCTRCRYDNNQSKQSDLSYRLHPLFVDRQIALSAAKITWLVWGSPAINAPTILRALYWHLSSS